MRTITWQQVYARRLAVSCLDVPASHDRLLEVATAICGVHAQLATGAELALSARVEDVIRDEVRECLWQTRSLVKANTIRGTLHVHPARDVPLWKSLQAAFEPRWRERWWLDEQELTLAEAEHLRAAVLSAACGRRAADACGDRDRGRRQARRTDRSRLVGHYLSPAGDLICHGPRRGRNVTFVRCDRWVEGWRVLDAKDALREACRRYLEAYGPARREELEHWLARRLPDGLFVELEEVDVEGYKTFVVPGTAFPEVEPAGARLLSHFDVYVIACHPRDHLIPAQKERIFLRGGGPNPSLLVDGRVGGVWRREERGKRMEIRIEPFHRLTKVQHGALAEDAARVARTYGAEPVLV